MNEDELSWSPFCGAIYPLEKVAGDPVICTRSEHLDDVRHRNDELGFEWW